RASVACGSRQAWDWVPVRNVASNSSGFCCCWASLSHPLALLFFCEKAADGPRTFPFHGAGDPPPSDTLPAFLRFLLSNTTGASKLRAASRPIERGRRSL